MVSLSSMCQLVTLSTTKKIIYKLEWFFVFLNICIYEMNDKMEERKQTS